MLVRSLKLLRFPHHFRLEGSASRMLLDVYEDKPWREKEWATLTLSQRIAEFFSTAKFAKTILSSLPTNSPIVWVPGQDTVDEDRLLKLWKLLEDENIHPVVGGSIAAMMYSHPRATKDIHLNVPGGIETHGSLQSLAEKDPRFTHLVAAFDGTAGRNNVPVARSHFKFEGVHVYLFYNSNFATSYAVENAREVPYRNITMRFIPPESVCCFKAANAKQDTERFLKDQADIQSVLLQAPDDMFEKISDYVEKAIDIAQGPNSPQLDLWKNMKNRVLILRKRRKDNNTE